MTNNIFLSQKFHFGVINGIESVYLRVNYFDEGQFLKDTALNKPEYLDTFKVSKQTFGLNLKYGMQFYLNRFVIDANIGLGIKYKVVNRSEMINENAYQVGPRHPNAYMKQVEQKLHKTKCAYEHKNWLQILNGIAH